MEAVIRKGREQDVPAVLGLIRELAEYEQAPKEVTNTEQAMLEDGFGSKPVFQLIVAEVDNAIVGMAIFFIKYSTWKGKGVYLDDIVVTSHLRGKGIGKKLFDTVVHESRALGARQLHWQVLDWNEPAINFYKKYQCSFDNTWINCKLTEAQINQTQ